MTAIRNSREDVIRAAGRLFSRRGYHATSMRDLAGELGLLGSSLYSHVASKEDLLVEVVQRGADLFQSSADRVLSEPGLPRHRLQALVAGHVRVVLDHLDEVRTFLNEADALDEAHRRRVLAARDRYESAFRRVLQEGVEGGSFRSDLDVRLSAIFILSILNAVARWYRPGGRLDRQALIGGIVRFVESGLS